MSSIMRWRNGLMALSVMAMAPVSHEVTNPVILRQDEPTCYPAIQHASRTLRRGGAPTASGLVLGREGDARDREKVTLEGFGCGLAFERPQPDVAVEAAGDDARAVGREGDAQDRANVTLEG